MYEAFQTETIETEEGYTLKTEFFYDHDAGAPWDRSEGHGYVREVYAYYGHPDKKPGERVLHYDRGNYWLYDWQRACKKARSEGWNAPPYDAPGRIERAVKADFDFLQSWLESDWHYCGIVVTLETEEGGELASDACWGFETYADYHETAAKELREALLSDYRQKRDIENAERDYWAARGVLTVKGA